MHSESVPSAAIQQRRWLGTPVTDAELRTNGNAFTMIRWILASTVMFSHAWDLTQPAVGLDPSVAILGMPISRFEPRRVCRRLFSLSHAAIADVLIMA